MSYLEAVKKNLDIKTEIKEIPKIMPKIIPAEKTENKKIFKKAKYTCCNTQRRALENNHVNCMHRILQNENIDLECKSFDNGWGDDGCYYDTIYYSFVLRKYDMIKYFVENGYIENECRIKNNIKHNKFLEIHANAEIFELLNKYKDNKYPEFHEANKNIFRDYENLYLADFSLVKLLFEKYNMTTGISIKEAIRSGRLDILEYGHKNNFTYDKKDCLKFAEEMIIKQSNDNKKYFDWCCKSWCNPNSYYGHIVVENIKTKILDYIKNNM
jgi:hypothetical protein